MILILFGGPGSGKGTQSTLLGKKYNLRHISFGEKIRKKTFCNIHELTLMRDFSIQGKLVPDDLILKHFNAIISPGISNSILDGFPRTKKQADFLFNHLNLINENIDAMIYLQISYDTLKKRNLGRIFCNLCKTDYNYYYYPPRKNNLCDKCGHELVRRDDCEEDKISTRLTEFFSKTLQVINEYNNKIIYIDGELSKDEVHNLILKELITIINI